MGKEDKKIRAANILELLVKLSELFLWLLTVTYLILMITVLPFFYTDAYAHIGSDKSDFFHKYGFSLGKTFLIGLLFYGVLQILWSLWQKSFGELIEGWRGSISALDRFAFYYGLILMVSWYYSDYRDTATLGTSGWYMGLVPHLVLLGSYFAISRFLIYREHIQIAVIAMLVVSFGVMLLGILNRYGVNPLHMASNGPPFISTIGNINWYCGYYTAVFFLGVVCFLHMNRGISFYLVKKILLGLYVVVGFITGITQGSDSGVLALAVTMFALLLYSLREADRLLEYSKVVLLFGTACVIVTMIQVVFPGKNEYPTKVNDVLSNLPVSITLLLGGILLLLLLGSPVMRKNYSHRIASGVAIGLGSVVALGILGFVILIFKNTLVPGSIGSLSNSTLFTFNSLWGSSRGGTWMTGINIWLGQDLLHRLVGIGPDCMAAYIYSETDITLYNAVIEQFGTARLTNAHGEWITLLANTGILGAGSFIGIMVVGVITFLRGKGESNPKTSNWFLPLEVICVACSFCIISYLANNWFSFETTINTTQIFMLLGLGEAARRSSCSFVPTESKLI